MVALWRPKAAVMSKLDSGGNIALKDTTRKSTKDIE